MSEASNTSSATGVQLPAPVVKLCKAYAAQDADLILYSAVGNDHRYIGGKRIITAFKVHKEKLRGSPVFWDMLECQDDIETSGSLPVVQLTEEAGVIQNLLGFLYGDIKTIPARDADLLSEPAAIYEATIKYQMPLAQVLLETIIKYTCQAT